MKARRGPLRHRTGRVRGTLSPLLVALLAFGALAQPAPEPTPGALQDAQRAAAAQREAAEAAARASGTAVAEERRLAERRVEAGRRAQAAEMRLAATADRARAAEAAAAEAEAQLRQRAASLSPAIPVMLRLALWPAESLLAAPGPAEDALRGLLVLQGLSREMAAEAETLRAAGAEAARRAAAAAAEAAELRAAQAAARTAAEALEEELAEARRRRTEARDAETEAARRAEDLAARATDLEGALARLRRDETRREAEARAAEAAARRRDAEAEKARQAAEARAAEAAQRRGAAAQRAREVAEARAVEAARARDASRARAQDAAARTATPPDPATLSRGARPLPVAGPVIREFGSPGEGGAARGMTLAGLPGARVVSPCGGRVVFGSAFRSYGLLLIVDCGGGYHAVLAGLDRLDASPGQRVLPGEPVGQMGAPDEHDRDGRGRTSLYLELRRQGRPVDPRNWFAARG